MQISELAQRAGVSVHALRHYEKWGLISPARRANGYRDYPEAMRREVIFIAMGRKIGFSLKTIAQLLPAYRAARLTFDEMAAVMRERICYIDQEITSLKAQRAKVVSHMAWLKTQERKQKRQKLAKTADSGATRAPAPAGNNKPPWPTYKRAVATRKKGTS